ncbi:hypothetical protein [Nocardia asteroides]|uniref:hypothetical protein n=1 Tax=Nocardia asteroides TaxID=1824 RepID=UPI001E44FE74|nr:hypothetical protein [Nocardia asteroides]UGT54195.1 hypothetical protein LTT85_26670 [Nocardia asteroides]
MSSETETRAGVDGRPVALWAAAAVVLGGAFVLAPRWLAGSVPGGGIGDEGDVRNALRAGFVEYWGTGDRALTPALNATVEYWSRYHLAKAVLAGLLVIVLVALAFRLWRAFLAAERPVPLGVVGALVTVLALFAVVATMANIQGVVAPYASTLPMLTEPPVDPELAGILDQLAGNLAAAVRTDAAMLPAVAMLLDDFVRFHQAMIVIACVTAVAFAAAAVGLWRRRAGDRRRRRTFAALAAVAVAAAAVSTVVAVANISTVADPAPALLALFAGSW